MKKPGPDTFMGMGMTNAKFVRRLLLVRLVMGRTRTQMLDHYHLRRKMITRINDGLFPPGAEIDALCRALGTTRQVLCGPESILIRHLRRRRAWEIGASTPTSS